MAAKPKSTYRFTAKHALHFSEDGVDAWANFERDATADDKSNGVKGYSFETDDAEVAERLRAVKDYGIAEVKSEPVEAPVSLSK